MKPCGTLTLVARKVADFGYPRRVELDVLSIPEVADLLGLRHRDVRALIAEGSLVGIKEEGTGFVIPRVFLQEDDGAVTIVKALRGTVTTLRDAGLTDNEAVEWLLAVQPELGDTPVNLLKTGNVHGVRRAAQLAL